MKLNSHGQSAVEYLLLLAVAAAVVMISFRQDGVLGKTQATSNEYFTSVTRVIMGENPTPIDGGWCGIDNQPLASSHEVCPKNLPCGMEVIYRKCACPEPAFGGKHCMESSPENASLICPTEACNKCTPENDICSAPVPACGQPATIGITSCSKKPCQRVANCPTNP